MAQRKGQADDGGGATLNSGTHCLTFVDRLRDAPSPVVATRPERWCTGDRDEHLLRPHRRQRGRLDRLGRGRARRPHDGLHALSCRDGARRLRRSQSGIFAPRLSGRPVEEGRPGGKLLRRGQRRLGAGVRSTRMPAQPCGFCSMNASDNSARLKRSGNGKRLRGRGAETAPPLERTTAEQVDLSERDRSGEKAEKVEQREIARLSKLPPDGVHC